MLSYIDLPSRVKLVGGFQAMLSCAQLNDFHKHVIETDAWRQLMSAQLEMHVLACTGFHRNVGDKMREQKQRERDAMDTLFEIGEAWYAEHIESSPTTP